MRISYPNAADRAAAARMGKSPGGDIFIHGQPGGSPLTRIPRDWTDGCIALSNAEIKQVWRLVKNGTPQWLMRSFLRGSCDFIGRHRKLKPSLQQPLLRKRRLSIENVLCILRQELAVQRCTFIVEIGGVHSHWTVIRDIGKAQVQLFDSDGLKVLNISELRMSYEKPNLRAKHQIVAGSVFMLVRSRP